MNLLARCLPVRCFAALSCTLALAVACTQAPDHTTADVDLATVATSGDSARAAMGPLRDSAPGAAAAGVLPDSTVSFAPLVPDSGVTMSDLAYLRSRNLLIPVPGVQARELPNTFDEARAGGERRHDAIDILAPRGTPVLSVDRGRVVRIDTSDRGGLSLYAADPSGRYMYYYAHLDAYVRGLHNSQPIERGDTLGYVGTTGNAPPNTPHLHFAINRLDDTTRWWSGTPINPWPLLVRSR